MAHKGKVVFEVYPGMNPTDIHIWMSASKPTVGLLVAMLADEGKIDLDKPVPTYVPELRGSAWEQATVRNVMNMSYGLDTEENLENLMNPDSWIAKWFTAAFELNKGDFREMSKNAKPLQGESAGEHFRYSGSNTRRWCWRRNMCPECGGRTFGTSGSGRRSGRRTRSFAGSRRTELLWPPVCTTRRPRTCCATR